MRTSRRITIACALIAASAAHISAQSVAGGASGSGGGVVARQTAGATGGLEIDGQSVTLRASGAALQVYLGDEPYPESRMKVEGDRTILLDKAGKPAGQMVVEGRRVVLLPVGGPTSAGRLLLGVSLNSPDAILAGHLGIEPRQASVISAVTEGWPADKAGLAVGDVIVSAGDRNSGAPEDVRAVIAEREAGDTVTLGVISAGERKRITVTLSDAAREGVAGAGLLARQLDAELLAGQYAATEARQAAVAKALVDAQRRQQDLALRAATDATTARTADLYRRQLQQEVARLEAQETDLTVQRRALAEYLAAARSAGGGAGAVTIESGPRGGTLRAVVPGAGPAGAGVDIAGRLAALEARIARMEELLRKLTEQSAGR